MTPSYRLPDETNGGFSASIEGSALKIHSSSGAQGIGRVNVTVDDGETTFTQPFGIIISGEWTAIRQPTIDFNQTEAVKREFFTSDGRQVSTLKSHGVYVMKVTDKQGTVHTAKIIAR